MTHFLTEAEALESGYAIEHRPDEQRFLLLNGAGETLGHAQYSRFGDRGINFNGTTVDPSLRGTGLAALLAAHALGHSIVEGAEVKADCWYMAAAIAKNPEILAPGAVAVS